MLIHRPIDICPPSEIPCFSTVHSPFTVLFLFDTDKSPKEQHYPQAMQLFDPSLSALPVLLKDPKGKPYLDPSKYHISITDCHNLRIIGLSDQPLGIDLERIRPMHWEKIIKRFFHTEETKTIHDERDFFSLWTAKESYVKYTGNGITDDYAAFSVFSLPEHILTSPFESDFYLSICSQTECNIVLIDMR